MRMRNSLLRFLIIKNDTLSVRRVRSCPVRRVILTIEHKLEIYKNLKEARIFTKAIKHVKFFTKTNGNKMTFSTQIMFESFRCLIKDVLLLFKVYDSAFFNPLAYLVFSPIRTVFKSIWADVFGQAGVYCI